MVSTAARAKTAPRIHRRYGLVFMLDTDTNDTGFPALSIYKFVQKRLFRKAPRIPGTREVMRAMPAVDSR